MWNDLRHSARLLRRAPAFTAAAVFTLALGIGLNAAVMSLVEAVLLRPLPYRDSERVVFVWTQRGDAAAPSTYDYSDGPQTPDDFLKWRAHNWTLEDMAAVQLWKHDTGSRFDLVEADRTERLRGAFATPNFFTMLGVQAEIGRTFSDADLQRTDVAVISNGLWRRLYAEDPQVVGKTIRVLAGRARREVRSLTIIGVLGPEFRFTYPEETEVWTPLPWDAVAKAPRVAVMYQVIGRLRAGASPQAAAADLTRLTKPVIAGDGRTLRYMVRAATAREKLARDARPLLLTLSAVAALVLAIACVNVANLLLARAVARSREIATRVALGATRLRVLRQLLLESSVLTALGAAAGLALAALALPAFRAVIPLALPRAADARIDTLVLAATLAAALVAVLLGSLASFMFGTSARPLERMRQGGVGGTRATLWRNSVTAAQVAIVFVLIAGAGLLLKSFWRVTHVDLGYDGHQVLTMEMRLLNARYSDDARQQAFQREVLDAVKALPGVQEAAVTSAVPLRGTDWLRRLHIETRDPGAPALVFAHEREVTPEYFTVMRVSLLQGRLFTAADDDSAPRRAIVSDSLARLIATDGRAIGRRLHLDPDAEIIGVVGDVRTRSIVERPPPAYYLALAQEPSELVCLVIRTAPGLAASVAAAARRAIHDIDPEQPVERTTTIDRIAFDSIADRRFYAVVTGTFSAIGLLLTIVGLAGVVARGVTERVREIAIRIALGADRAVVRRMIVRQALRPVCVGLIAGICGALWATGWLRAQLFEVVPHDPITFAGAAFAVLAVAAGAAFWPARRATRVEPNVALRAE